MVSPCREISVSREMSNTDPTHPCVQVCPPRFHLDIWKINENNTSLWFLRRCPSYASQKVSCSNRSDNELRRRIQFFHKCALIINAPFVFEYRLHDFDHFLPYEIEILTYRQGFGDPHWSGYVQIVEIIQAELGTKIQKIKGMQIQITSDHQRLINHDEPTENGRT